MFDNLKNNNNNFQLPVISQNPLKKHLFHFKILAFQMK